MIRLSYILRVFALAVLFGGSIATIVAAITFVQAAALHNISTAAAAAANAPMFLQFSRMIMPCGFMLLAAESLDYAGERKLSWLIGARYAASFICIAATMILSFGIIPAMKDMHANIHDSAQAYAEWTKFHEASRIAFGIIILSSAISLIIPAFAITDTKQRQ